MRDRTTRSSVSVVQNDQSPLVRTHVTSFFLVVTLKKTALPADDLPRFRGFPLLLGSHALLALGERALRLGGGLRLYLGVGRFGEGERGQGVNAVPSQKKIGGDVLCWLRFKSALVCALRFKLNERVQEMAANIR